MIRCGVLDAAALNPATAELAARLQTPQAAIPAEAEIALQALKRVAMPRYAYTEVPILRKGTQLDLGFGPIESRDLAKNLAGCERAYLFAVTLGGSVDRHLRQAALRSPADHFIADAVASALAEAACDCAAKALAALPCAPRFSIGYGDLSLSLQPAFLARLEAAKHLGLSAGQSLLMVPTKSITAIMGILK